MTHRPDGPPDWMSEAPVITQFRSTSPVAAKEYVCGICHGKIQPGERHLKIVYKDFEQETPRIMQTRQHLSPCDMDLEDYLASTYP
jgi:hypothetical protein